MNEPCSACSPCRRVLAILGSLWVVSAVCATLYLPTWDWEEGRYCEEQILVPLWHLLAVQVSCGTGKGMRAAGRVKPRQQDTLQPDKIRASRRGHRTHTYCRSRDFETPPCPSPSNAASAASPTHSRDGRP